MLSEFLQPHSLPSDEKEANYSNSDRGRSSASWWPPQPQQPPTTDDGGYVDGNANFCDAFGGDILQLARSLEQIALPPFLSFLE